jgi:tetratricopeptide (TPR) repeat protein
VGRGGFEAAIGPFRETGTYTSYTHAENFAVDWAAGWGIPVAILALVGFGWTLRPTRLGAGRSVVALASVVGVGVLLLQNLVDLALEVPAVGGLTFAVLGGLWGANTRELAAPTSRLKRVLAWVPGSVGLIALASAAALGRSPAPQARTELAKLYAGAELQDAASRERLFERLRDEIRRHPGDAYFPRLAALAALRDPSRKALPLIAQALRRDPRSGRSHFVLAHVLMQRGARDQALMELRLAAEHEPILAALIARYAVLWGTDARSIERAFPPHDTTAGVLLNALSQKRVTSDPKLRLDLLEIGVERYPDVLHLRSLLANQLLATCRPEAAPCIARVRQQADAIRRLDPTASLPLELTARIEMLHDRPAEAERLLEKECTAYADAPSCLQLRAVAARQNRSANVDDAVKAYVAAACTGRGCADAAGWAGDFYGAQGMWGSALPFFERAARLDPSRARWTKVGEVAERVRARDRALIAFRRASRAGEPDAELERRIDAVEGNFPEILDDSNVGDAQAPKSP